MDRRLQAIFSRRSIRAFTGEPVAAQDLHALLEAAMAAPSANNRQPWHFVVITARERLNQLAEIHPHARMLTSAGGCIAVCGDTAVAPDFWVQDCSAATENILVAAAMLGLGSCWLGVHPRKEREAALKELLKIPDSIGLLCLIAIGRPAEKKEPRTQFDPARIHSERW